MSNKMLNNAGTDPLSFKFISLNTFIYKNKSRYNMNQGQTVVENNKKETIKVLFSIFWYHE